MVNKVLLTYNPGRVMDGVAAAGDMSNPLLAGAVNDLVQIGNIFIEALRAEGIQVDEPDYEAGFDHVKSQVAAAQFIWHNFNLLYRQLGKEFGVDREKPQKKVESLCEAIRDSGKLPYSHGIRDFISSLDKVQVSRFLETNDIPTPKTQSVDEYLAGDHTVPVVLKDNGGKRGEGIFLVERLEQLVNYFDPKFYQRGIAQIGQRMQDFNSNCFPEKEDYHVSEFIETPSEHYTHFRILTFRGDIIAGVLNYSADKKSDVGKMNEDFHEGCPGYSVNWTTAPDSPMYLDWRSIISNRAAGSTQIPLSGNGQSRDVTDYEKGILVDHNIDPTTGQVPEELQKLSNQVGMLFSQKGASYLGQDWVMDKQGNFYCLEVNDSPGMEAFNEVFNQGKGDEREGMRIGYQRLAKAIRGFRADKE